MQITVSDELAAAACLTDLSDRDTQRACIIGLFAEQRLTLVQAARPAGLDRAGFQSHLAARGIAVAWDEEKSAAKIDAGPHADKPWLVLRDSARYVGDPFAPVVSANEISVLQRTESGLGS